MKKLFLLTTLFMMSALFAQQATNTIEGVFTTKAKDELYELSEKFNEMFERLEFSFEKGSLFNMKVWMKLLVKKKGPYPFWI